MRGQEHIDKEFAAKVHKVLSQDAADWAAAFAAAIETASTGREWPEIPSSWIVPPGLPKPRLPGVGPLPGP